MNFSKLFFISCFILLGGISQSACKFVILETTITTVTDGTNDPYGIIEAAEYGGQSERLLECSQDEVCPEHAQALFWLAADILSNASAETILVDGKKLYLTDDMSEQEMMKKFNLTREEAYDSSPPEYNFEDSEFQLGLKIMKKAYDAGSLYAANELGLLHMEHSEMLDLDLAKSYFETALDKGDLFSAYNLARIARLQTPKQYELVLEYLEIASHADTDFLITYMLGLKTFGTEKERQIAEDFFYKNSKDHFIAREDFIAHFVDVPD